MYNTKYKFCNTTLVHNHWNNDTYYFLANSDIL